MRAVVLSLLLCFPSIAEAQSCYEPTYPQCLTGFNTFEDEFSFNLCRRAMNDYAQEIENYSRCMGNWVQSVADDAQRSVDRAVSDYEGAIRYWNCKAADPTGFCGSP